MENNIINENMLFTDINKFKNFFNLLISDIKSVTIIEDYEINLTLNKVISQNDLFLTYSNLCIYYKIAQDKHFDIHKIGIKYFEYSTLNNNLIINMNFSRLFKDICWKKSQHYQALIDLFFHVKSLKTT